MSTVPSQYFWFCSQPFVESSLLLAGRGETISTVTVRDADGAIVNEASIGHQGLSVFDLASAVLNVKLESGLRHGTVEVVSSARASMRFFNKSFSRFFEPARVIAADCAQFAPVTLGKNIENLVCLLNCSDADATVRVRLILAKRNPDTLVTIPARGTRIMCVEREFSEITERAIEEKTTRAYVRVSLRSELPVLMQAAEVFNHEGGLGGAGGVQVCPL